jgi:hypothetical protein
MSNIVQFQLTQPLMFDDMYSLFTLMTTPFDPTTNDRKEWTRLAASKWLPPIVQKEIKTEALHSTPKPDQKKSCSNHHATSGQSFPNQEIRSSNQTKKKLMVSNMI